jgi:hypothetical protein
MVARRPLCQKSALAGARRERRFWQISAVGSVDKLIADVAARRISQ